MDDRCRFLFRHLFDDFKFLDFSDDRCTKSSFGKKTGLIYSHFPKKCLGPGASEKPLDFSEKVHWAMCFGKVTIFPKKAIGPDASEKPFGSSGGVRGAIWGGPGRSRRRLGGSWGEPGVSWEGLGRSWGDLGATF